MKVAAVDIGTNSTRLLILNIVNDDYQVVSKKVIITRLGEGVDENQKLKKSAINRVIAALENFQKVIRDEEVKKIKIIGTSALRDVENEDMLVDLIKGKFGYELEIISGKREAELVYRGASTDISFSNFIVIDIGGGSTEFISKDNNKIKFQSLNLGAVRFTEKYINNPAGKINKRKRYELKSKVFQLLNKRLKSEFKRSNLPLVGVGGTITTTAAIKLKMKTYNSKKIHKFALNKCDIKKILNTLSGLNLKERKKINGLQPQRADIINMGLVILESIMDLLSCDSIIISEKDILWGIVADFKKRFNKLEKD